MWMLATKNAAPLKVLKQQQPILSHTTRRYDWNEYATRQTPSKKGFQSCQQRTVIGQDLGASSWIVFSYEFLSHTSEELVAGGTQTISLTNSLWFSRPYVIIPFDDYFNMMSMRRCWQAGESKGERYDEDVDDDTTVWPVALVGNLLPNQFHGAWSE